MNLITKIEFDLPKMKFKRERKKGKFNKETYRSSGSVILIHVQKKFGK